VARRLSSLLDAGPGVSSVSVNERFVDERQVGDEDVYLIEDDFIDWRRWPTTPSSWTCRSRHSVERLQGTVSFCGIDRNEETCECQAPIDSRWATLDGLRFTDLETGESKEV